MSSNESSAALASHWAVRELSESISNGPMQFECIDMKENMR